jgi:hypothetical protein
MRSVFLIVVGLVSFLMLVVLGVMLYALPATVSLPGGPRPGVKELTIDDAAERLSQTDLDGWDLIEKARLLVGERFSYCRRNSFDSYRKAFQRGYGYCQQEAYALAALLRKLGFDARPVHCEHCDFASKEDTGHAWVQVVYGGGVYDIDSKYMDHVQGELLFQTNSSVRRYTPLFRLLAGLGCTAANAYRYYKTGSDSSPAY